MKQFSKTIFYLVFFILFLLSFVLIEGDYKFYLFFLWSAFLLFFSGLLKKTNSKIFLLSFVLLSLFFLSTIFSKSIPLSIEKMLFYLLSISIFIFFYDLPKKNFNRELFLHYFSLITITLNSVVLFYIFFEQPQNFLSGMNLLVRSYGHNHYAAFLLLMLPVFWWQFLFSKDEWWLSKKESKFLSIVLLLSSYLLIIFSLARLVLIISLFQLLLIFFINKKYILKTEKNEFTQAAVHAFTIALIVVGFVFLFLSSPLNNGKNNFCPFIFIKKELCKPILQNDRIHYWKIGYLTFKENPIIGSGLKTFNFVGKHFPTENYQFTSYAHNIFIHNLAEGGLLAGGFFIFFILRIFYKSFLVAKNSNDPLKKLLFLSALASLINALFDFDWHFFVIFSSTLIFLAMILHSDGDHADSKKTNLKIFFIFTFLISGFFALGYFQAEIWRQQEKKDLLVKYFPYFDRQVRFLIGDGLSTDNFEKLYSFYKNDSNFIYHFSLTNGISEDKKIKLQQELADIDPILFIKNIDFSNLSKRAIESNVDNFFRIADKYNLLNGYNFITYEVKIKLFRQIISLANSSYQDGELELASKLYKQSLLLNPFIPDSTNLIFLKENNYDKLVLFLKLFSDFDPEKMHKHTGSYVFLYEKTLIYLFKNNRLDDFFDLSDSMSKHRSDFSSILIFDLKRFSRTTEELNRIEKVGKHFNVIN